jgi:hypothetical protein
MLYMKKIPKSKEFIMSYDLIKKSFAMQLCLLYQLNLHLNSSSKQKTKKRVKIKK